jgi:hypothetical protein
MSANRQGALSTIRPDRLVSSFKPALSAQVFSLKSYVSIDFGYARKKTDFE